MCIYEFASRGHVARHPYGASLPTHIRAHWRFENVRAELVLLHGSARRNLKCLRHFGRDTLCATHVADLLLRAADSFCELCLRPSDPDRLVYKGRNVLHDTSKLVS